MIPRPEMISKLDLKWSRTADDPLGKRGMAWSLIPYVFIIMMVMMIDWLILS